MVERQVWPPAEGPNMGAKALGVPLGSLVDHSPHSRRAALSWGMSCFFAFCCDGAPQLSQGNWEICWYYMLPPQKGKHYCCIDAAHSNLFQHKWQGEQRKTEKDKWRVAGLLQVSPVIKSVYSLHVNPSFHTCQLPGPRPILDPSFTKESLTDTLCVYFKSAW